MDVTMSQQTLPPKQQSQKTRMTQLNQLNQPQLPSVIRSTNRVPSQHHQQQQPPSSLYQQPKHVGVDSNKNHTGTTNIKKGTVPSASYGTGVDKSHESLYAQPNVIGGNFYLSSNVASSQAPSTNRRGPEIQTTPLQFSNQQQPPGRLDDYFQQMQAHWGQNPTNANLHGNSSTQLQVSQQLRGQQSTNIGANRSNSQAVRGTKGRATQQVSSEQSATTNTSMQQLQARLHMKQAAGQKNTNSHIVGSASGVVNKQHNNNNGGRISRLPNHNQIASEYINAHVNRGSSSQDPPQSEQMVRTPLKTMKARQNRNRTTENQNSRTSHHHFLQQSSQQQLHNEYATPAVGRHQMLTGGELSVEKLNHAVNGGSAEMPNLKSLQQRIPNNSSSTNNSNSHVNSRLQPINLTKQIYGATQQKAAITSGSYIIEQQKHNNVALQESSDNSRQLLQGAPPANVGLLYPPHPEKHSKSSQNAREKGANNTGGVQSSSNFQSTYSNKIPLLKVGIKKTTTMGLGDGACNESNKGGRKIVADQPQSKVHTEGNQMTPQSNMIENNIGEVNDELLVTFFDKSLIQKRLSQEEATYRHSLDDKQPDFHTQDSSILGDPTGAIINENSRSDTNLLAPPPAVDDQTNQRHSIQSDKNNNHLRLLQKSSNHLQTRGTNAYKHQNTGAQIKHQSLKNLATTSVGSLNNKNHNVDQSSAAVVNHNGSDIGDRASFNLETEPNNKSTKFNQSMVLVNQPKNLHPQGLYIGGQKQRKSQKASISGNQRTNDLQSSQNLNQSLQDESMDQNNNNNNNIEHDSSHLVSALNRSMLVQECDLSQTGLSQAALSGMIDLGNNVDSERLSSKSIGMNNNHLSNAKFGFFKDQQQMHRAQASNHSVDTSPLTKTYNLKSKLTYKSKVNLKSFLLNTNEKKQQHSSNSNNQSQKQQTAQQADRASQRSIVESTNAYIRAAQQQQEQNRMQYLQSAGTIQNSYAQNGLTEADIGPSRFDFLASSSLPYRGMMGSSNLVQGTSTDQQHSSIQLQTSAKLNNHQYMSGSQLQPLEQIHSYQNLQQMQHQHSEEQNLRKRGELDPNITLFQLRQEIHRVPHQQAQPSASQKQSIPPMPLPLSQYDIKSRQSDLSKNSMNLPSVGSKAHLQQQMQSESFQTNSYQTITLQRSEATTGSMVGGGKARQANFALSAEKTKTTNTSKKIVNKDQQSSFSNVYHEQNDSSLGQINLAQQNNSLQTINPAAESKPGDEMLYSNQKSNNTTQSKPQPNQNPFKKVPKLHVFNKSRRLKTSSASRQTEDKDENQTDQQTITTGIGQLTNIQAANAAIKIKNNQPGLETNPTTLDITSQTSNVYGTIDQKSEKQFSSSGLRGGILASAPHYKQSLRQNNQQLILNQDSEEKYRNMDVDRATQIASAASPYLQNLAKINIPPRNNEISVEKKSRPQTQEQSQSQASAKSLKEHFNTDGTKHLEDIGRRQSKVSRGSRQLRQQLSESRQSNASSLNQEHNATAKFAVVTTESQAMQEAARHSFYGTQVVIKQQKGENTAVGNSLGNNVGISRMSKKNIVLSKGSSQNSSNQNQKSSSHKGVNSGLPRSGKNCGAANAIVSKKLAKLGSDQANLRNIVDMNQTFNVASYMQNQNSSATSKQIYGGQESSNISRKGAKLNGGRRSSGRVRNTANSPGNNSVYNQSSVQKLSDHKHSEQGSQERMTRNDSAQTPYFLPTPQRTDSNWGDQMRQQDSASQLQAQQSKHFVQIQDALENLKSSDAIRRGLVNAAEGVPPPQKQHNKEFKNKIKIEQSSKDISALRNNLNQLSKKNSSRVSENESNRGGGTKKTNTAEQPEDSQKRLEEALQQQASYADQREKLQSSNKAYRQSTKQSNSRGRQQLQQQALPKTIL